MVYAWPTWSILMITVASGPSWEDGFIMFVAVFLNGVFYILIGAVLFGFVAIIKRLLTRLKIKGQ